jgi:hypothetical protein
VDTLYGVVTGKQHLRGTNHNGVMSDGDDISAWVFHYHGASSSSLSNRGKTGGSVCYRSMYFVERYGSISVGGELWS